MKKIKGFILMGILGMFILPGMVSAASLSYGTPTSNENKTTVPLSLSLDQNEQGLYDQIKLKCDTDNVQVTCTVKQIASGGFYLTSSGDEYVITYVEGDERILTGSKYTIAELVLENEDTSKKEVEVAVTDIKLVKSGDDSVEIKEIPELKKNGFKVAAKVEEKQTSNDATLKELVVSEGTLSPKFKPDVNKYIVSGIKDTISKISFDFVCNDGDCTAKAISGGSSISASGRTVNLAKGENVIKYQVTAADRTTKNVYEITVYRGSDYNSPKISELSFGDYTLTPEFDKDVLKYTMVVPNKVNSVDEIMEYTLVDENAKVEKKGTDNLVVGENTLTLKVTNVSGDETVKYQIVITRQKAGSIEIVSYKDGEVTYHDEDGITTTLKEKEFKKQYEEEWKKIESGEYEFDESGNLKVEKPEEPKDEETKEETEKPKSKTGLIVVLIIVGLAIIGIAGFFIFRKKKPKADEIVKEDEIDESGVEEELIEEENGEDEENQTVDIDEALSDLLSTKKYDFEDDDKE